MLKTFNEQNNSDRENNLHCCHCSLIEMRVNLNLIPILLVITNITIMTSILQLMNLSPLYWKPVYHEYFRKFQITLDKRFWMQMNPHPLALCKTLVVRATLKTPLPKVNVYGCYIHCTLPGDETKRREGFVRFPFFPLWRTEYLLNV